MLDLRAFRTGADEAWDRLARRDDPAIIEALDRALALDARRREVISEVEVLKARRNDVSREIGDRKREGADAANLIADMQRVADRIRELDADLQQVEDALANPQQHPQAALELEALAKVAFVKTVTDHHQHIVDRAVQHVAQYRFVNADDDNTPSVGDMRTLVQTFTRLLKRLMR